MQIGQYVTRKKYNQDIIYEIYAIKEEIYYLKGVELRLLADSTLDDLIVVEPHLTRHHYRYQLDDTVLKGRILHIDGDESYLSMCEKQYKDLNVRAICVYVKEEEMAIKIIGLLEKYQPDLLVITGHDARSENEHYSHSSDFAKCIRKAREYEKDKDRLIIFAGACQSDYERLIAAGANFASSPKRVNIHALDPVHLMSQVAVVNVKDYIDIEKITQNTTCKMDGIGGIDTKGVARKIYPRKEYL